METAIGVILGLAVGVFYIIVGWKIYAKAGAPGWAVMIPFYNLIVMLRFVGKPAWWLVLFLIPIVSFIVTAIVMIDMARVFGKNAGFGIGLLFLSFIFGPILAFGDATYQGTEREEAGALVSRGFK